MLPSLFLKLYSHSLIISPYSVLSSPLNKIIFITSIVQIAENQTYSEEIIIPTCQISCEAVLVSHCQTHIFYPELMDHCRLIQLLPSWLNHLIK